MPVVGYVGLPGSGKTLSLVEHGLKARAEGRAVYANFRLGKRVDGYLAPECPWYPGMPCDMRYHNVVPFVCGDCGTVEAPVSHKGHAATGAVFVPRDVRADARASAVGWRKGRGFVPDDGAFVLRSWDDLINLRVGRDTFDKAHVPGCRIYDCGGCSKGITVLLDELNLWAPSRLWQELGIGVLNRWAYTRKDGLEIFWSAQHEARIDKVAREVTDWIWTCKSFGGRWVMLGKWTIHIQCFNRTRWIPQLLTDKNRAQASEGAQADGIMGGMFNSSRLWFRQDLADGYDTYEHVSDSGHLTVVAGEPGSASRRRSRRRTVEDGEVA